MKCPCFESTLPLRLLFCDYLSLNCWKLTQQQMYAFCGWICVLLRFTLQSHRQKEGLRKGNKHRQRRRAGEIFGGALSFWKKVVLEIISLKFFEIWCWSLAMQVSFSGQHPWKCVPYMDFNYTLSICDQFQSQGMGNKGVPEFYHLHPSH